VTQEALYINDTERYGDRRLWTSAQLDEMDRELSATDPEFAKHMEEYGAWSFDGGMREFTPDYIRMWIGWQGETVSETTAEAIWTECVSRYLAGDVNPMSDWLALVEKFAADAPTAPRPLLKRSDAKKMIAEIDFDLKNNPNISYWQRTTEEGREFWVTRERSNMGELWRAGLYAHDANGRTCCHIDPDWRGLNHLPRTASEAVRTLILWELIEGSDAVTLDAAEDSVLVLPFRSPVTASD
jgi:hypothetical protein